MEKDNKLPIFKGFITRIGEACGFKPSNNNLFNALIEESKKDSQKYNDFIDIINNYWQEYKKRSEISYLLKDHYTELFSFYLTKIFPFRLGGVTFEKPEAPTPIDFKIIIKYRYNQEEIEIIKEMRENLKLKTETKEILKRILYFTIDSIGPIIEGVFGRPFAIQFMGAKKSKYFFIYDDDIEVVGKFCLREQ